MKSPGNSKNDPARTALISEAKVRLSIFYRKMNPGLRDDLKDFMSFVSEPLLKGATFDEVTDYVNSLNEDADSCEKVNFIPALKIVDIAGSVLSGKYTQIIDGVDKLSDVGKSQLFLAFKDYKSSLPLTEQRPEFQDKLLSAFSAYRALEKVCKSNLEVSPSAVDVHPKSAQSIISSSTKKVFFSK